MDFISLISGGTILQGWQHGRNAAALLWGGIQHRMEPSVHIANAVFASKNPLINHFNSIVLSTHTALMHPQSHLPLIYKLSITKIGRAFSMELSMSVRNALQRVKFLYF